MAPPDDSAETPAPPTRFNTPRGLKGANRAISELAALEASVRDLTAGRDHKLKPHNDAIAQINAEYSEAVEPILIELKQRLKALRRWYRRNLRKHGEGRTISLAEGVLGMQLDSAWTVDITGNKAEVVSAVRRRGRKYIKVTESIIKARVATDRLRFRKVKGLRIHRYDRFYVTPIALRDLEAPEDGRLRVPVEDLTE